MAEGEEIRDGEAQQEQEQEPSTAPAAGQVQQQPAAAAQQKPTLLNHLGEEVTGIVAPVSICMLLCVTITQIITPHGSSNTESVAIATIYYHEQESDSVAQKVEGGLINSVIFVGIIGLMTFILFVLFKYRCTRLIWGYMAFACFNIFFTLGGVVSFQIIRILALPVDLPSFYFVLYNFSIVGVALVVLAPEGPLVAKQGYMVFTGAITAFVFTKIPEWTTWVLLLAMSAYDLCAVLTPAGPLKVLLELAVERGEDIPALIYEARPAGVRGQASALLNSPGPAARPVGGGAMDGLGVDVQDDGADGAPVGEGWSPRGGGAADTPEGDGGSPAAGSPRADRSLPAESSSEAVEVVVEGAGEEAEGGEEEDPGTALLRSAGRGAGDRGRRRQQGRAGVVGGEDADGDDDDGTMMLPDSIKLGLGDFVFYSVMVGRAAMYDMMTVYACYLAIMAGLGGTLLLLAVFRKALPALPFSICLGVVMYLVVRIVLEPYVVGLSTQLIFF